MAGRFLVGGNAVIFKKEKVLALKRSEKHDFHAGKWECVSGRFEQHVHSAEDEMYREINEELGPDFKCRIIAPINIFHFYRGDKSKELIGIDFICKYISGDIKLSWEHSDYKWIRPEEFEELDCSEGIRILMKKVIRVKSIYLNNPDSFS